MIPAIQKIKNIRLFILKQITDLSEEELNTVPENYSNNIIWNLAHLICAHQGICYLRAAQQPVAPEKYIAPFTTGTKPDRYIPMSEIEEIRSIFIDTIGQFEEDYEKNIFTNYTASPGILKNYGIQLKTINDAIEFILYHEGYHAGQILALKKLVCK